MGFKADLERVVATVRAREALLQERCAQAAFDSIRDGSPITGAPGQPVDSGDLYNSYQLKREGPRQWSIESTGLAYADIIEENRRGATLRSSVGGFHSVKLTRLGWRRLVAHENRGLGGAGSGRPSLARNPSSRDVRGRFTGTKKALVRIRGR